MIYEEPVEERKRRRYWTLVLLLLLLLVIFCSAQAGLVSIKPEQVDIKIQPIVTADYRPYSTTQFEKIDPALLAELERETLRAGGVVGPRPTIVANDPTAIAEATLRATLLGTNEGDGQGNGNDNGDGGNGGDGDTGDGGGNGDGDSTSVPPTPANSQTADAQTLTATNMPSSTPNAATLTATNLTGTPTPTGTTTVTATGTQTVTTTPTGTQTTTATTTPTVTGTVTTTATTTRTVSPSPSPTNTLPTSPVASFNANPASGDAPLVVNFVDTSTGNITSWAWNFGDGVGTSTAQNPSYTYTTPNTYTVTLTVTGPGGSDSTTRTVTVNTPPPSGADLSISKVDSADPILVGGTVNYTITVTNNGPAAATGVIVSDTFSGAGVTINSVSSSQGGCGGFPCNLGTINSGANATISMTVTGNAAGTIVNNASVTSSTTDPNGGNNSTSQNTTVNNPPPTGADLTISKVDSADPVLVGDPIAYTITVTNNGPLAANAVQVTDTFSGAGVTVNTVTASQGGCTAFPCNLGTINSGNNATITINVTANAAGTVTNNASVTSSTSDPNGGNNTTSQNTTVNIPPPTGADLTIIKVDSADPVLVSGTVIYTLTVTNSGPDPATGVVVSDTFSGAAVTINSVSSSQGGCTAFPCNLGSIATSGTATITINVTADAAGTITNNTSVTSATSDPNGGNNAASETTSVINPPTGADLAITKVDSADPVLVGGTLDYTITVANNGPDPATGVVVADTFSGASVTVNSVTPSQGGCAAFPCNLGTINSGNNATITVNVTANTAGTITNNTSVASVTTDPIAGNNSATETTTVVPPSADLAITKVDNVDPVVIGNNVIYTITVSNAGPDNANNVQVTDTFSGASITVNSVTSSQGGCTTFPCDLGTINSGNNATITVDVTTNAAGTITNNASVSSTSTDFNNTNNSTAETTSVVAPSADLSITKVDNVDPVTTGNNVVYTVTVNNSGPDVANNVVVNDTFSGAAVTFNSVTSSQGGCTSFPCNLGSIGAANSAFITVNVTANAAGTITNDVNVTTTTTDPNAANDADTETTTVVAPSADLSITKTDSLDPVTINNTVVYTITVNNAGPDPANAVQVADTFSGAAVTINSVSASQGGCTSFPCNLGTINPSNSATITVNVTANAVGTITNDTSVSTSTTDPVAGNNSTSETTTVIPPSADLSITKTDNNDPVTVGNNVIYTITVNNAGPDNAPNVQVTDTFSGAAITVNSVTSSQGGCSAFPCDLGTINSGNNATITVNVTTSAIGTITNDVTVSSSISDPNNLNNSDTETTTVVPPSADLSITKSDNVDPVVIGNNVVYTITVNNAGPDPANNVQVTDTFSGAGVTVNSVTSSQGGCAAFPCDLGTINAGNNATITVNATTNAVGTITNDVAVSTTTVDPNAANNTATEDTTVIGIDLNVTKTVNLPNPNEQQVIQYTVRVQNSTAGNATGVQVTDLLPTGVSYFSDDGGGAYVSGTGVWTVGNLNSGVTRTLRITATVDSGTNGTVISNVASITAAGQPDPNAANNTANAAITVRRDVDFGAPDGDHYEISCGQSIVLDLRAAPIATHSGYDFVYYEKPDGGSFLTLDLVVVEVGTSPTGPWSSVFNWGNGVLDANTSVGQAGYGSLGEPANAPIPTTNPPLYGTVPFVTGIAIDVDAVAGAGTYEWLRINSAATCPVGQRAEVDGIGILPFSPTADLSIVKVDDADPVTVGNNVNYTITVTNNGPDSADNVTVTDTFSGASITVNSVTPSQGGCAAFPCNLGTINSGNNATITVNVTTNVSGTVTNDTSVSSGAADTNLSNNSATETTTVDPITPTADLAIVKVDNIDPVLEGNNVVYTITVTNNGPDAATAVQVTDTFSGAAVTINSVSSSQGGCTTFPCDLGTIPFTGTATISVNVTANAAGTITNNVAVTASTVDPNGGDNSAIQTTTVDPLPPVNADLAIGIVDDVDPVTAGSTVVYTITVTNGGPDDADSVMVNNVFSGAGVTIQSVSSSQGGCATLPCDLGTILNGNNATVTVTVTADSDGIISSDASVSSITGDPNNANNSATETTTVVLEADVSITKVDDVDPLFVGSTVTYTLTIDNAGPNDAENVQVTDTFSGAAVNVIFVSSSQGACSVFPCDLGTIPASGSATITIIADTQADGTVTNDAAVTTTTTDPVPGNNAVTETTTVDPLADLTITKVDDADPIMVGNTVNYTITVTNNGPSDATSVTVADTFSGAAVTVNSITPSQGGCVAFPCDLGTINAGNNATIVVNVTANAQGTITNSVSAASPVVDPNGGNNNANQNTTVNPAAGLSVSVIDDADPVDVGNPVNYTITVNNAGPSGAINVSVDDVFSGAAVTINSVVPSQGGCAAFPCNLGTIPAASNATIVVNVTTNADGVVSSDVTVSSPTFDPNLADNVANQTTTVNPLADLSITIVDDIDPVTVTNTVIYTISITNNGPSDAANVSVDDIFSGAAITINSVVPSQGSCTAFPCDLGTITSGNSATITVNVTADVVGTITQDATVTSTTPDPNGVDNVFNETTTVDP